MKKCPVCGSAFEPSKKHPKQKYCNVNCQAKAWRDRNPEKVKSSEKKYRENNPEKVYQKLRKASLKRRYGITLEKYQSILDMQGGVCAICGKAKEEILHVDHDHATGKVRGLLCGHCNHVLGFGKDDMTLFEKAIKYLKTIDN
jgi:hypothetical protein